MLSGEGHDEEPPLRTLLPALVSCPFKLEACMLRSWLTDLDSVH